MSLWNIAGSDAMTDSPPKLFISYSWTTPDHEEWVLRLATELRDSGGVDVILDKWDLREGHDAHAFMEKMVTDGAIKKVVLVCDQGYVKKANERHAGVGTEAQIISPEIYSQQSQSKFVAVIAERDGEGKPFVPVFYASRIYIDLSSADVYSENYERLLRWIHDKPLHEKPAIGKRPAFLDERPSESLQTSVLFRRAADAVRESRGHCDGTVSEYFDTFAANMVKLNIVRDGRPLDDLVVERIEDFMSYRNELAELFVLLARYRATEQSWISMHRFFESILTYYFMPAEEGGSDEILDHYRFVGHELFIHAVAALVQFERFDGIAYLFDQGYYVEAMSQRRGNGAMSFSYLRRPAKSLETRNNRLGLRRESVHSDMLLERCQKSPIRHDLLVQADFLAFMRDCAYCLSTGADQSWWPILLARMSFHHGVFPIFVRAESRAYFERLKSILGVERKEDLLALLQAFGSKRLHIPSGSFFTMQPAALMGYDSLASKP